MEGIENHSRPSASWELQEFAQTGLKPDENLLTQGKEFAQKVFTLLQSKSKYSLARVIIGGSVGKSTAIKQIFDFDCVIFINGQYPPFNDVLDELEDILLCCGRSDIADIKTTAHSVQFKCPATEFEYDLLPAVNFVSEPHISGEQLVDLQRKRTLDAISFAPKWSSAFSSSLVESQVQFMKSQSSFVHELVRLCKFWNKTIYIEEYVSGRSTIMELIAVHVGQQIERFGGGGSLILTGFTAFLKSVQKLPHLDIKFDGAKPAAPMRPPILLEPSNPFNNLLSTLDNETIRILGVSATQTLTRLFQFESIDKLFDAQPNTAGMFAFELQPRIYIGTGLGFVKKSMVVHNKKLDSDNWTIHRLKSIVETYVLTDVIALTNEIQSGLVASSKEEPGEPCTDAEGDDGDARITNFTAALRDHFMDKVSKLIFGQRAIPPVFWDKEEVEDVEFTIPYEGLPFYLTVGFRFIKKA